jgi:predicted GNAT family acetyltransferase
MLDVRHNTAASRFEADVAGGLARADYRLRDGVMQLVHTEVPRAAEGRGVAAQVVRAALEYARANGLRVLPLCSYVREYIRAHPDTQDLLPDAAA